jgi:hypothetical protein
VPEGGGYHVLDGTFFAVGQLHGRFSSAHAGTLTANLAGFFRTLAWPLPTDSAWPWRGLHTLAGIGTAFRARLRFERLAIPFRIAEMNVGPDEVVDGAIVFAIEKPCATPNDLLELDHGVDRAHQHDVANVAGIHAG